MIKKIVAYILVIPALILLGVAYLWLELAHTIVRAIKSSKDWRGV